MCGQERLWLQQETDVSFLLGSAPGGEAPHGLSALGSAQTWWQVASQGCWEEPTGLRAATALFGEGRAVSLGWCQLSTSCHLGGMKCSLGTGVSSTQ